MTEPRWSWLYKHQGRQIHHCSVYQFLFKIAFWDYLSKEILPDQVLSNRFSPLTWCFFSFNLQRLCGVVYLKVEWWYNQINILKHWYRFINKLDFQHLVKLFYLLESKLWDNATINCGLGMRGGGWNYPQQLDKSNYMGWWNGMTISVKWVIV